MQKMSRLTAIGLGVMGITNVLHRQYAFVPDWVAVVFQLTGIVLMFIGVKHTRETNIE